MIAQRPTQGKLLQFSLYFIGMRMAQTQKYNWNYRAVTGMLNYLTGSTRPDIAMAVHQISRFGNNPKLSHEKSIIRICRYLIGTAENGMIFKSDKTKDL